MTGSFGKKKNSIGAWCDAVSRKEKRQMTEGEKTMNKLYVINFRLSNGYIVSTWWTWDADTLKEKKTANPEWTFSLTEDNAVHQIWDAK